MSDSTAVAETAKNLPALASTPALEIEASDIGLGRLYIGQYMSDHVQENRVPAGSLFTALGADDQDPQILAKVEEDFGPIHILAMRRGKSWSDGGELHLYAYDDPDAPAEAWVTYNYVIALPEVDQELPYKWLLTKTSTRTAKNINTVLAKNAARGPAWSVAFEVKTNKRENDKGKFFVPTIRQIEASEENIAVCDKLAALVADEGGDAIERSSGDEPAI